MSEEEDVSAAFRILALPLAATLLSLVDKKIFTAEEAISSLQSTASGEVVGPISKRAFQEVEKLEKALQEGFDLSAGK